MRFPLGPAFVLIVTTAACVHDRPAAEAAGSSAPDQASSEVPAICDALMAHLRARELSAATAMFDAQMRRAVPTATLAQVWRQLESTSGPLGSWKLARRSVVGDQEVCEIDAAFARNHHACRVVVARRGHRVSGLWFGPPVATPTAEREQWPCTASPAYRCEDVEIGDPPLVLGGTLTIPRSGGPFPAAVLVAGSGPHDRDGLQGFEATTFPGLNHLFMPGTGAPSAAEYLTPGHVAPEVVARLASFISEPGTSP